MKTVYTIYFSPTGNTKKIVTAIAQGMNASSVSMDLTLPGAYVLPVLTEDDIVILGGPVYSGRIASLLLAKISDWHGNGAHVVLAATYGNRAYDDALLELHDWAVAHGFRPLAAGAFAAQHSSAEVALGHPTEEDLVLARQFGAAVIEKLAVGADQPLSLPGNRPYKTPSASAPYGPQANAACTGCGTCSKVCPTGAMSLVDDRPVCDFSVCICCFACVRNCPVRALGIDHPDFIQKKQRLEAKCGSARKEPSLFL